MLAPQVQEILQGCLDGKRSAQKALYDRYAGRMMAVCRRYIPSVPEAEDVFQEAWVKLFQNLERFKMGEYSFDAWIQRIFINESINYYHKNRRHNYWQEDITDFNTDFSEAPEILGKMSANEIETLIDELPEGAKVVFNLFVVEGYSHADIAESLGINEGTSRSQLNRAREILKKKYLSVTKVYNEPER